VTAALTPAPHAPAEPRVQRRTVLVLSAVQVLGGVAVASGVAVNGVLAKQLSRSTSLSGLAQTMSVIGAALLAVPLARLAGRRGRRPALSTGYALATVGAGLSLLAGTLGNFELLLLGAALFGGGSASGLQARYAAVDAAAPARRARSLSIVVWATTVGSVVGPNLSGPGGRLAHRLAIPELAGPFVFSVLAFALAVAVTWTSLRPDPLEASVRSAVRERHAGVFAALRVVGGHRGAVLGLVSVGIAHAVMVGVMVMTPVHLQDHGATLRVVGLVISVHIAGMYAASPLFGWFADRAGRVAGVLLGSGLLAVSLVVAATADPMDHVRLGIALILLGLGWSSCLVSGSTLLTESVPAVHRTAVQGLSDLVMGTVAAAAGLAAGPVLAFGGFPELTASAGVLLVPVLLLTVWARSSLGRDVAAG
jgi:MFS family permease